MQCLRHFELNVVSVNLQREHLCMSDLHRLHILSIISLPKKCMCGLILHFLLIPFCNQFVSFANPANRIARLNIFFYLKDQMMISFFLVKINITNKKNKIISIAFPHKFPHGVTSGSFHSFKSSQPMASSLLHTPQTMGPI